MPSRPPHAEGVKVIGTSNFHDFGVYDRFEAAARQHGLKALFGLEFISVLEDEQRAGIKINDPANPGRAYICGKGIPAPTDPSAAGRGLHGRRQGLQRSPHHARWSTSSASLFAAAGLEVDVSYASIVERRRRPRRGPGRVGRAAGAPRRPGLPGRALRGARPPSARAALPREASTAQPPKAAADDAVATQGELRSRLMKAGCPAFVEETPVPFTDALAFIRGLGAIAVYPTLADGVDPICGYEDPVEDLIERMGGHDIYGAELIPVRNTPAVRRRATSRPGVTPASS